MERVVIDTNVFVAAMRSGGWSSSASSASGEVLRRALLGRLRPLFGNALFHEYADLLGRREVWTNETTPADRENMLSALAAVGEWVTIYYNWRPNLQDEGDNHLVELAIAGNARAIVTHNAKDLRGGQLKWPQLRILSPAECLEELT